MSSQGQRGGGGGGRSGGGGGQAPDVSHNASNSSNSGSSSSSDSKSSNSSNYNSNTGNQFTVLLATMMELRTDLEKTVSKLQEMEQQNANLIRNYDIVKGELIDTRKKYNEIKENYNDAVKDRIDNERKYENLINSIKSQLMERTREFDKQKEILKPKDIDSIRIKVQEELEIPHKLKMQAIVSEMDQYKASMFEVRKAYEVEVTALKAENQSSKDSIDFMVKKNDVLQQTLRDQISDLQAKLFTLENDDKTRSLAVKIHELEYSLQVSKSSLTEVQNDRDKAVLETEKLRNAVERLTIDYKTKIATIEVELVGAKEKASLLLKERDYKDGIMKSNSSALDDVNSRLELKEREINDLKEKFNSFKDNMDTERRMVEDRNNKEVEDNANNQKVLQQKLISRDETIRRLQKDISDVQLRAESEHIELRRSNSRLAQEFNARVLANELEIALLKGTVASSDSKLVKMNGQIEAESTKINSEKAQMKREKDIMSQKLTESGIEARAFKEQIVQLENDKEDLLSRLKEKDVEIAKTRQSEASVRALLERARLDSVEVENRSHKLIEAVRAETKDRLINMQETIRQKIQSHNEKADKAIQHEKLRSEAYKKKAVSVYERYKSVAGVKLQVGDF